MPRGQCFKDSHSEPSEVLFILKTLHDLSILEPHNCHGKIKYIGSRIFIVNRGTVRRHLITTPSPIHLICNGTILGHGRGLIKDSDWFGCDATCVLSHGREHGHVNGTWGFMQVMPG